MGSGIGSDPLVEREHEIPTELVLAVVLVDGETAELVIGGVLGLERAYGPDRLQGGHETQQKMSRGVVDSADGDWQ